MLAYVLVPMLSLLLPASASRRLIRKMASWQWLLQPEARVSCERAAEYTVIADRLEWMRRWRCVAMLEARDRALLAWGRRSSVFREIQGADEIERCRDRVLVGM
ncbi:MAG: hypothetical protein R3348_07615, partial [Xanthomonadales bacterium]|nr:hypothetical protein [Xanthomonadales bacterium]